MHAYRVKNGVRVPAGTPAGCGCGRAAAGPCPGCGGKPALAVACKSLGIGDNLLALPVARGLQDRHPGADVWLRCPPGAAGWARLFWPRVTTGPVRGPVVACDEDRKREFDARRLPRWRVWADDAGVRPELPGPLPLPADAAEWAVPCTGRVLLAPFAGWQDRTWALAHWQDVERQLAGHGFECVVLDDLPGRAAGFRGRALVAERPERVAAALAAGAAFCGNDSGMAHVAGLLGVRSAGVCHPASDRLILDLYPNTVSLQAPRLDPGDVVRTVLGHVRAAADAGFPREEFLAALPPADAWRRECWPPVYAALWRAVRELAPRTAVEIGTRAGAGTWTILDAAPGCTVTTVDLPSPGPGGLAGAAGHARAILAGRPVTFVEADSRTLERVPEADLVYVDGDHAEGACLADLGLAERSGAGSILVDDYANRESVRTACRRFLAAHPHRAGRFIPSATGLYLITAKGA